MAGARLRVARISRFLQMSQTPPGIRWHDAMLVTPTSQRHLSQRIDGLVQALPGRYQPFFWGVIGDVEFDPDALAEGIVLVRRLEAVMRNGRHVAVDEPSGLRLDLALTEGQSAIVHIALDDDVESANRYVPCGRDTPEIVLGEDGVEIPLSRPRLVLDADPSPPSAGPRAETRFPLCEVRRDRTACSLTAFVPPTLRVTAGSALDVRCRPIAQMLRAELARATDSARSSALVASLPAFELVLAGHPHPFALYVELARLAGAVAVLRNHAVPPPFPPYDHDAAHIGFDKITGYLLQEVVEKPSGPFTRFPFERESRCFSLRPDPGWTHALAPDAGLDLVLTIECDDAQAQRWGENCVIASRSVADTLLRRRLVGCARRRVTASGSLPSGPHLHHFRLTPNGDALRDGEDLLAVGNLGGPEPSAVTLFVTATTGTR